MPCWEAHESLDISSELAMKHLRCRCFNAIAVLQTIQLWKTLTNLLLACLGPTAIVYISTSDNMNSSRKRTYANILLNRARSLAQRFTDPCAHIIIHDCSPRLNSNFSHKHIAQYNATCLDTRLSTILEQHSPRAFETVNFGPIYLINRPAPGCCNLSLSGSFPISNFFSTIELEEKC